MQFRNAEEDARSGALAFERAVGYLGDQSQVSQCLGRVMLLRAAAVLSEDPCHHLHKRIRNISVFLQYFDVNLDGAVPELVPVFVSLVLAYTGNELVNKISSNLISSDFK